MKRPDEPAGDLGFAHVFIPAEQPTPDAVTLLLLHGTGGDERDLLQLGRELWPGAALLGVRGKVLENGMPRFFRRFEEGVFDVDDLKARTDELAEFIDDAAAQYRFNRRNVIAVGYSNGANIAASLVLLHPHYLKAAVLFRAMVPFTPDIARDLTAVSVFIGSGDRDPIVSREQPQELASILAGAGADVTISWHRGGHELGRDDVEAAKAWLSANVKKRVAA